MRKAFIVILSFLVLVPSWAHAAQEEVTTLRFGCDKAVFSIYASYEVEDDITEITVKFADHVKQNAYFNVVDGTLWISIAAMNPIDLSGPIGWATGKSAGQDIAPELKLRSLRFNGNVAESNLAIYSMQTCLDKDVLRVETSARDDFRGQYTLVTTAFDANGKMLACEMQPVVFLEEQQEFSTGLMNCAEATCVKTMFVSQEWSPTAMAVNP